MPKLEIDTDLIERLAELLRRTGLTEIELGEGQSRIRVACNGVVASPAPPPAATAAEPAAAPVADASHPGAVTSPMVGTAYLTPEPGAAPYVTAGDRVEEGQTLLIIEAMKVMNPVRAPRAGQVTQIFIASGDPVEYGELLLLIE